MGLVKEHLRGLIERQAQEKGIVVWLDPERHYEGYVAELAGAQGAGLGEAVPVGTESGGRTEAGLRVEVYGGSFFELRRRIDALLELPAEAAPRLVVYVPLSAEATENALIELTAAGVVMQPGRPSPLLNTRLAVVAKAALRTTLAKGQLAEIESQVENGKLTLEDVDRLGTETGAAAGVISVIFGTTTPRDIALALLEGERLDGEIAKRGAAPDVAAFLGPAFGVELPANGDAGEVRAALARFALATEFAASLGSARPAELASVKVAADEESRAACVGLVREWRNRRDLRESYAEQAERVEGDLQVGKLALELAQLRECETFAAVEARLQRAVEECALEVKEWTAAEHAELRELVARRLRDFWSAWPERYPAIQPRWQIAETAIELLYAAATVERGLKALAGGPEAILERYAQGTEDESPWCLLDTHHRHLERRVESHDFAPGQETLERLVALARRRYREVGELLSERFLRAWQGSRLQVAGLRPQRETFAAWVAPALKRGKTAYVLVDALRFEMARELAQSMPEAYAVALELSLGTVPSTTPIGMAACLPGAERGIRIVAGTAGKLVPEIDGAPLKSREDRVKWVAENVGPTGSGEQAKVFETKLETLLRATKATQNGIKSADLVLVTSQEIDELAESDNVAMARRIMDDTLVQLQRAIRRLADLGCGTIVVTADHGHVFADELESDTKIDAPGGQTVLLHRRVWVGKGGASSSGYLRTSLADLGVGAELDVAVPWGFGGFKVQGGASAYFHGGMAPQEIAIPVLLVRARAGVAAETPAVAWAIALGSTKITTRMVSVQVTGAVTGLFKGALPRVRVEIRIDGKAVSAPVFAHYGFNEGTQDVELKLNEGDTAVEPNTLMVAIESGPGKGKASVHLLDAATGVEMARVEDVGLDIAL
ncbi:MAG: PglZ domain-containing protein [Chloroflexi bacterium]|nr:PglZ domain-containing protein [Chloroflexota bacterium]